MVKITVQRGCRKAVDLLAEHHFPVQHLAIDVTPAVAGRRIYLGTRGTAMVITESGLPGRKRGV
jgi:hypothetical protein